MCQCSFKTGYCNYIAAGRGIGMKFAFLFSFLAGLAVAILSGFILRMQLNTNDVDSFIDTLPVVKIQDGRIVEPVLDNVVWTIPGEVPEDDIYVVANTTIDNVEAIPSQVAVYITAKRIYTQDEDGVHAYDIPEMENTVITHNIIRKSVTFVLAIVSVLFGIFSLIVGLLSFLFAYMITLLFGTFFNKNITKSGWGRALVLPWVILWIASIVSSWFGYILFYPHPLLWIILLPAAITLISGSFMKKCLNAEEAKTEEEIIDDILAENTVAEEKTPVVVIEKPAKPKNDKKAESKVVVKKTPVQTSPVQRRADKPSSAKKRKSAQKRTKSVKK